MKSFRQRLKNYSRIFYWIFIFLITAFLLHLILPGEPKFKYEYQKGSPWKHENLIAPFDFAIFKTDEEINKEKEELTASIPPYFTLDTLMTASLIERLQKDLRQYIDTTVILNTGIEKDITEYIRNLQYNGILLRSIDSYSELKGKTEIYRLIGNKSALVPVSQLNSEKTAYNELITRVNLLREKYPEISEQLSLINFNTYISANLEFNEVSTQRQIDETIAGISKTHGLVQAGERVILRGEIINNSNFTTLESLKQTYEKKQGIGVNRYMVSFGKAILILVFLTLIFIFLFFYRNDILMHFRQLLFLLFLIVLVVLLSMVANQFEGLHIYVVPIAILPILIRTFFDSRTAIFTLIITSLMIGFYAPNNFEFVILQVIAGMVAVFSLIKMHRRVHLVMASLWVLIAYILTYSAIQTIQEGNVLNINYRMFQWFAGSSLFIFLVYPLIWVFEKVFGFISDVTLIELSDTNQPLLRKLAEEAPGTFQHSMQIANLAEEVILKIGGNPFLVRAGALYHDIGKIAKAYYFTENQFGIQNPHDELNNFASAEIIIDHVKDGIKMAKKHKLPLSLFEFIATHHGTTKTKYFLINEQKENVDTKIDELPFTYPGPLPHSKEAAVVMLVDGIEAASRSLKDKNIQNIKELVDSMIDSKVRDNQLDESDLTFRDISVIKTVLLNKLINIYHVRIAYPKEKAN